LISSTIHFLRMTNNDSSAHVFVLRCFLCKVMDYNFCKEMDYSRMSSMITLNEVWGINRKTLLDLGMVLLRLRTPTELVLFGDSGIHLCISWWSWIAEC
jgi:hypothetical protein